MKLWSQTSRCRTVLSCQIASHFSWSTSRQRRGWEKVLKWWEYTDRYFIWQIEFLCVYMWVCIYIYTWYTYIYIYTQELWFNIDLRMLVIKHGLLESIARWFCQRHPGDQTTRNEATINCKNMVVQGAKRRDTTTFAGETPCVVLVGGFSPPRPEKYEFVNWDEDSKPIHGKFSKMATKPPTSWSGWNMGKSDHSPEKTWSGDIIWADTSYTHRPISLQCGPPNVLFVGENKILYTHLTMVINYTINPIVIVVINQLSDFVTIDVL